MARNPFYIFETLENYPKNVAEKCFPQDSYFYVPITFLNGFINYIDTKYVIMIKRHTEFDLSEINKFIERLKEQPYTNYDDANQNDVLDDILIIGETQSSYWIIWRDKDCSESGMGRFNKDKVKDFNELKQMLIDWVDENYPPYVELPIPDGRITL